MGSPIHANGRFGSAGSAKEATIMPVGVALRNLASGKGSCRPA